MINGDTVVLITEAQLLDVNRTLNKCLYLQKENELLQKTSIVQDSIISIQNKCKEALDSVLNAQEKQSKLTQLECARQLAYKEALLTEYKKKSRKTTIGVGVGGTLLGFILGVLLSK